MTQDNLNLPPPLNPNPEHSPYEAKPYGVFEYTEKGWQHHIPPVGEQADVTQGDSAATGPGSLEWYDSVIDDIAAAEKLAIRAKLKEYGLSHHDDPFAIIRMVASDADISFRQAWFALSARHRNFDANISDDDLVRRCLDFIGYGFTILAKLRLMKE